MSRFSVGYVLGLVYGTMLAFGLIIGIDHATRGHLGWSATLLLGAGCVGLGGLIGMGAER